jgi:excisionase family DNA binding protein
MKKNEAIEIPEIMTLHDAAEFLDCHPVTIHRLVTRGGLPGFRLGRQWRFRRSDIDKWIAQRQQQAPQAEKAVSKPERQGRSRQRRHSPRD